MNVSRSLTFLWTPASLIISVIGVMATAVLCFISWRRSGYRASQGVLELLRLSIVCLAVVLLNQPEWVESFRPEEKPSVAVLWDASASMDTRDATTANTSAGTKVTRREAIAPLTESTAWESLAEDMEVSIEPFSAPEAGHGSDLQTPLAQALEKMPNLRGVVLASDGDWNEGQPPVQAAARLRLKGIPVFVVPVGSATRLPDVELLSLDARLFE